MAIKDFSILFEPVTTTNNKKDISLVSGFNAISQYIEHVLKTQKGELVSETIAGVDRTYKVIHSNPNDSYFLSTIYGSEYLRIKKENSYFRGFTTWKFLLKKK